MSEYVLTLVIAAALLWGSFFQVLSLADEFADVAPPDLTDKARLRRKFANRGAIGAAVGGFIAFCAAAFGVVSEGSWAAAEKIFTFGGVIYLLAFIAAGVYVLILMRKHQTVQ